MFYHIIPENEIFHLIIGSTTSIKIPSAPNVLSFVPNKTVSGSLKLCKSPTPGICKHLYAYFDTYLWSNSFIVKKKLSFLYVLM